MLRHSKNILFNESKIFSPPRYDYDQNNISREHFDDKRTQNNDKANFMGIFNLAYNLENTDLQNRLF